jgi:hypothetical protein
MSSGETRAGSGSENAVSRRRNESGEAQTVGCDLDVGRGKSCFPNDGGSACQSSGRIIIKTVIERQSLDDLRCRRSLDEHQQNRGRKGNYRPKMRVQAAGAVFHGVGWVLMRHFRHFTETASLESTPHFEGRVTQYGNGSSSAGHKAFVSVGLSRAGAC